MSLPLPRATQQEPRPIRISACGAAAAAWCLRGVCSAWRAFSGRGNLEHGRDGIGCEMAVGDIADLHGRGQRAAAETGDFFDGEEPLGVGVVAFGDVQVTPEGVHDVGRALDMAGGADADADDVLAGRAVAELVVERADALDIGRTDCG